MDPEDPVYETEEEQYMAEVEQILLAYRQQKLREHLVGPIVSFVMHGVILLLLAVFVVGKAQREPLPEIEVTMEEVPIKELEPPEIEEIEQMASDQLGQQLEVRAVPGFTALFQAARGNPEALADFIGVVQLLFVGAQFHASHPPPPG